MSVIVDSKSVVRPVGHILIVDDTANNRDILTRRLRRRNYQTTEAKDGPEALRLIDQMQFDLVLLDVMMPGMSGFDVLRAIRTQPATRDLPVVMVTANPLTENVAEASALGANDYITKPVNFERALACIEMHLKFASTSPRTDDARSSLRFTGNDVGDPLNKTGI